MKFVIQIPILEMKSAGVRVLVYLNELLVKAGYRCEINGCLEPEHIAIYPDVVRGNPMGATNIVRYMLYYPTAYFGGDRIPKSELPTVYHETYYESVCQHCEEPPSKDHIFFLPSLGDGHLLYPDEKTVSSVLYVGKCHCGESPTTPMPVITRAMSREECLALLRKSKQLYSLDHESVILSEAQLCGCKTFLVKPGQVFEPFHDPEPRKNLQDPERDVETAKRFAKLALDFFKISNTLTP